MERWLEIYGFPGYSISSTGRVRNDHTRRIMKLSQNQIGVLYVGLRVGGVQYNQTVAKLVARAFLEEAPSWFDSPMHLDGDRSNNNVENLIWRPRWYATRYHNELLEPEPLCRFPIRDPETGRIFPHSRAVAMTYGLLESQIKRSIRLGKPCLLGYVFEEYG